MTLVVISKMWCYECLKEMIPHVYTVQFDVEPQAAIVSWLDMRIVLETSEILGRGKNVPYLSSFCIGFSPVACVRDRALEGTG